MSSGSFKNVIYKPYVFYIYMNKKDLALDNLQWFICHETRPNQINPETFEEYNKWTFAMGPPVDSWWRPVRLKDGIRVAECSMNQVLNDFLDSSTRLPP